MRAYTGRAHSEDVWMKKKKTMESTQENAGFLAENVWLCLLIEERIQETGSEELVYGSKAFEEAQVFGKRRTAVPGTEAKEQRWWECR